MKVINKIIYRELVPHWKKLLFTLSLILFGVIFEAIAPWPFKVLIDNVLGQEAIDATTRLGHFLSLFTSREALGFFVVLVFCVSSLAITVIEYFVSFSTKKFSKLIVNNFSQRAFANVERLAVGYFKKQEVGDYIYRLSYDVSALGEMLEVGVIPLVTNSLYLISTILIMFVIDAKLAWLALLMLPLLALGLGVFNRKIGGVSKISERSNSALFSFIEEVLSQLKIIQAFNQEGREAHIFKSKENSSLTEELNVYGLGFLLNLLIGMVIAIGYAVIIMYGIRAVSMGEISTGLLIVFIFYLDNLTNPLLTIVAAGASLKEDYVRVERMADLFTKKFQVHDQGDELNVAKTDIVFDKVTLRGEEGLFILKDISFTIPAGKKTVIVGVSGSGKTSIISLLLRFIEPTAGRITLGGKKIQQYSLLKLRESIAYVPQEVVLFNDTIRNNIAFGNSAATPAMIKKAAWWAVADEFIRHLPGSYDFVVGEEGANLSGGQRQRLMLARAFLKTSAPILIFDEPLSSLDIKTRKTLMDNIALFASGKTTIIVSNVLEIINEADKVILINEGKLLRAGSGKNILEKEHLSSLIIDSE